MTLLRCLVVYEGRRSQGNDSRDGKRRSRLIFYGEWINSLVIGCSGLRSG